MIQLDDRKYLTPLKFIAELPDYAAEQSDFEHDDVEVR